ncbi:hypothetical protein [Neptunicella marina]|uniref:Bulb-type lectin domain-containing protein n=1 Tax=Neptunicella marina TaxID=2125989 RepID=A0A8J6M3K8_9ALTE|nr:hypothetical protein [Neptunicella marina]MBC3767167.1 hypothetical protein [Neptunicella marina]
MRKVILVVGFLTCFQAMSAIVFVAPKKSENQSMTYAESSNGMMAMGLNLSAFWLDEAEKIPSKTLLMEIKGQTLELNRESFYFNQAGKLVWTGVVNGKPESSVGLVLDGQRISGTLYYDGQLLLLLNEANGNLWLKKGHDTAQKPQPFDDEQNQIRGKGGSGTHFSRFRQ